MHLSNLLINVCKNKFTQKVYNYIYIYIYETCLLFLCNLPFSCITNRIFRLISIFVTARCFDGFSDVMFSPCMCFFTFFSSRVFLGAVAPWLRWVFLGIKALKGRNLNLCFVRKVFWYGVDIVHADVVMGRLHSHCRGSCSIGSCRFSKTQSSSTTCCVAFAY